MILVRDNKNNGNNPPHIGHVTNQHFYLHNDIENNYDPAYLFLVCYGKTISIIL